MHPYGYLDLHPGPSPKHYLKWFLQLCHRHRYWLVRSASISQSHSGILWKEVGLKKDPWGIPHVTFLGLKSVIFKGQNFSVFSKKDLNQSPCLPSILVHILKKHAAVYGNRAVSICKWMLVLWMKWALKPGFHITVREPATVAGRLQFVFPYNLKEQGWAEGAAKVEQVQLFPSNRRLSQTSNGLCFHIKFEGAGSRRQSQAPLRLYGNQAWVRSVSSINKKKEKFEYAKSETALRASETRKLKYLNEWSFTKGVGKFTMIRMPGLVPN